MRKKPNTDQQIAFLCSAFPEILVFALPLRCQAKSFRLLPYAPKRNGFRVFSCPKIFDGFSWRSMVFDRFFIVNEGLTAVFRAYIINKRDRWGRELDIEVRCMLKDRVDYINESIYNV